MSIEKRIPLLNALRAENGTLETDKEKSDFVKLYDFHKMAEQDEEFWCTVFEFLEKYIMAH